MKKSKPERKHFEVGTPVLQFECKFAVYPRKMNSSVCYCTDKARATLIAKALSMYVETPDFEKFMKAQKSAAKRQDDCGLKGMPKLLTKFPKPKKESP